MSTFTSNLPDDLLDLLSEKAKALSLPQNKLIERALRLYLKHLDKAEYIKSHRQASNDPDLVSIAEEGMEDYLNQIEECYKGNSILMLTNRMESVICN